MGLVIDTSALVAAERVSRGKKNPGTEQWEQVLGQVAGESARLFAALSRHGQLIPANDIKCQPREMSAPSSGNGRG